MKWIEDQVCSLEIAQRLKELNVRQNESWFHWIKRSGNEFYYVDSTEWHNDDYAAFTVAELGEMLPQSIDKTDMGKKVDSKRYDLLIEHPRASAEGWHVSYWYSDNISNMATQSDGTTIWLRTEYDHKEADVRGKMLIWLLEEGLVDGLLNEGVDEQDLIERDDATDVDNDSIDHPSYYTAGGIEVIDFIEAKGLGYHLGNAVKYLARAGKKDPE